MKHNYFKALAMGLALCGLFVSQNAMADFKDGDFNFVPAPENGDTEAYVTSSLSSMGYVGDVVIPSTAYDSSTGKTYTVTGISQLAFQDCSRMTSITFPETIKVIETRAFNYCVGLTSVTLPASLSDFGRMVFTDSYNLTEVNVAEGSEYFSSKDGILYDVTGETLIYCPECRTEVDIPEGVKVIEYAAFFNCQMTRVSLPETLERIGIGGFEHCESLPYIEFPASLIEIDSWGFDHCLSLEEVTCGKGVKTLGSAVFQYCSSLRKFTGSETLEEVGEYCFMGCDLLEYVYLGENTREVGSLSLNSCTLLKELVVASKIVPESFEDAFCDEQFDNTILYVLEDMVQPFADADPWCFFKNIEVYVPSKACPVMAAADALEVNAANGVLTAAAPGTIVVYSVDGTVVARGEETLQVSLPAGVYLVKSANNARKVLL